MEYTKSFSETTGPFELKLRVSNSWGDSTMHIMVHNKNCVGACSGQQWTLISNCIEYMKGYEYQ
jgi:hypothetical protein